MLIPAPQSTTTFCPKCASAADFACLMLSLSESGVAELQQASLEYPHRLTLEIQSARQIVWYFPEFYTGPWQGWEGKFGVVVCPACGWRGKHTWRGNEDYYYSLEYKGRNLYLRTRQDVLILLDYTQRKRVCPGRYPAISRLVCGRIV